MSKLGQMVRKHRRELGLSGRRLADKIGIDHSYLSRIESGEQRADHTSWGVLQSLTKHLRISMADVTGDPGFRELEEKSRNLSEDEKKILDGIMELPYRNPKRIAALQLLGLEDMLPKPRVYRGGRPRKKKRRTAK